MFKKIFSLSFICVALFSLAGCSEEKSGFIVKVAVSPDMPPMLYEKDGKIVGADYDIFNAFCKKQGCSMQVTAYEFKDMLNAVADGKADVAFSGISITDERKKVMDFSTPYFYNDWHFVSMSKDVKPIKNLSELKQYSLAYPKGMVYDELVKWDLEPKSYYSRSQVKLYPSFTEIIEDLKNRKLDLTVMDEPVYRFLKKSNPNLPVESVYTFAERDIYGFAFAKGSPLREKFNKFLADLGPKKIKDMIDHAYSY